MDSKQSVELTIRTAQLMKAVSGMVGTTDRGVARLVMAEIADVAMKLDRFIEACDA